MIRIEKVVITGGRKFVDDARITADLAALIPLGLRRVAQGNAKGADAIAAAWARRWLRHDGGLVGYPAEWDKHGRAAGCLRNVEMLETERPDLVLAYPDPESRGTWHCVRKAIEMSIPVILWHVGVVVSHANVDPNWLIIHHADDHPARIHDWRVGLGPWRPNDDAGRSATSALLNAVLGAL